MTANAHSNSNGPHKSAIKKVQPYPIAAKFWLDGQTQTIYEGLIVKLTTHGLQIDLGPTRFNIGDHCTIEFTMPVSHKVIIEQAKFIKILTSYKDTSYKEKTNFGELHFTAPKPTSIKIIDKFETDIKQK